MLFVNLNEIGACFQFLAEQGYEVINVQGGMMAFEEL